MPRLSQLVVFDSRVRGPGLRHLPNLREVRLGHKELTDHDLAGLAHLGKLQWLYLDAPLVTDAGLAHLENLQNVSWFHGYLPRFSDAGMVHLARLANLEWLNLEDRTFLHDLPHVERGVVTVRGLKELAKLKKLRIVVVDNASLDTLDSWKELSQAMPRVEINGVRPWERPWE